MAAPVSDAENAVPDLRRAASAVPQKSARWEEFEGLSLGLPLRDKEVAILEDVVGGHPQPIALVRAARAKGGVDWGIRFVSPTIHVLLPDLNGQRGLANFLHASALLSHHEGNDAEALERVGDLLFISRAVDRQPTLVSHLVATGISAMASKLAAELAPDLRIAAEGAGGAAGPEQVRALIAELLDDGPPRAGFRRAFLGERVFEVDTVKAVVEGRLALGDIAGGGPPPAAAAAVGYLIKPAALSDAAMMADHVTAVIRAFEASADWPTFQKVAPADRPKEMEARPAMHVMAAILMPSLDRAVVTQYRATTDRRLTATAVALRWYAMEHGGKLPAALAELVPRYLPAVPADPLAAGGKPIGYVAGGARSIVYSVGENGTDEGGSEQPTSTQRGVVRPDRLDKWRLQDAVLHLTRQPRPKPEEDEQPEARTATTEPATRPVSE
jgi:hypothetical protein